MKNFGSTVVVCLSSRAAFHARTKTFRRKQGKQPTRKIGSKSRICRDQEEGLRTEEGRLSHWCRHVLSAEQERCFGYKTFWWMRTEREISQSGKEVMRCRVFKRTRSCNVDPQ